MRRLVLCVLFAGLFVANGCLPALALSPEEWSNFVTTLPASPGGSASANSVSPSVLPNGRVVQGPFNGQGMLPDASNAELPTAINNLLPGTITAALSASNTASQNTAAIQTAINDACTSATAYKAINFLPGNYNIANSTITVPCGLLSIGGWGGKWTTTLNVATGTSDIFVCVQPDSTASACWKTIFHDFALVHTQDNPTAGHGIYLDHTNVVTISRVRIENFFEAVLCNYCNNTNFGPEFQAYGTNTTTGSTLMRFSRTVTTRNLSADTTSGAVLSLASLSGIYVGQAISGSANIPASTTVLSCSASCNSSGAGTVTMSASVTGTVSSGTPITFADGQTGQNSILPGSLVTGAVLGAGSYGYDNAIIVEASDVLTTVGADIGHVNNADVLIQPQKSDDHYGGILMDSTTILDLAGAHGVAGASCMAIRPYGAVYATMSSASGTSLTLTGAPSSDVTGLAIIANGYPAGTTVTAGGTTSNLTTSAAPNSLGVTNGDTIIFYSTAYAPTNPPGTFQVTAHCVGLAGVGIVIDDPALSSYGFVFNGTVQNTASGSILARAGSVGISGSYLALPSNGGGTTPLIRFEGIAGTSGFLSVAGTRFDKVSGGTPANAVSLKGQAVNFSGCADCSYTGISGAPIIDDTVSSVTNKIRPSDEVLFSTSLPGVYAGSGSVGNNGALTLGTALPVAYPAAYIFMQANAISAGSAAGWYYATCSTTSACTLFNNTYTSGQPQVPDSPTAFSTTGPGSYTATTASFQSYPSYSMLGKTMGKRSTIRISGRGAYASSGTSDQLYAKLGTFTAGQMQGGGNTIGGVAVLISNRESRSVQVACPAAATGCYGGGAATALTYGSIDTSSDQNVSFSTALGVATHNAIIESATIELLR